jgi:hypothetical protein
MTTSEPTTDAAALIAEARKLADTFLPGKWPDTMNALASALEASLEREGRLRDLLEATEIAMEIGAEHNNVAHRTLCADVRDGIRRVLGDAP